MVISVHRRGDKVTEEVRYYILSEYLKGEQFAKAVLHANRPAGR